MFYFKLLWKDLKNIRLFINNLNFKVWLLFLTHPVIVRRFVIRLNAAFQTFNNDLIVTIDGDENRKIKFLVKNISDIKIILEIFYELNYKINTKDECVVIDVGMNKGAASLYFASQPNIKKVFSYEPFKETYESAIRNFELNKELKEKIYPHNFGISDNDADISVNYSSKDQGLNTVTDVNLKNLTPNVGNTTKQTVKLAAADKIFSEIINSASKEKIIVKMDCEGSEYKIFDCLDKAGLFPKISYILLEWHFKGENILIETLLKNGFVSFSRKLHVILGFIKAVNVKNL
ncbi:MAG: FkbM family methyltransferase [Endomicrobia bacterium]|nr:FkbM family methyltransferase [Endomicrobiia bacterium]